MYYDDEYESIDDIARGEGFFIDDDGNWIPSEYAEDFGFEIEESDYDEVEDYIEEIEDWEE